MNRFNVVVINYNKLFSFINNFHKLLNFSENDIITVISIEPKNEEEERKQLSKFNNYKYIVREKNHGMNQLPHLDFITDIANINDSEYLFVMQDHYLDTESDCSRWDERFNFRIKGDVIPDNITLDLNKIDKMFKDNSNLSGMYCDRRGPERLHFNEKYYIATNGNNQINICRDLKDEKVQKALKVIIKAHHETCDGLSNNKKNWCIWTAVAEYLIGVVTFSPNLLHYDLFRNKLIQSFNDNDCFSDIAESTYVDYFIQYNKYIEEMLNIIN
jgi:hypothetical protein